MKAGDMVLLKIEPNPMVGIVLEVNDDPRWSHPKFKVLWNDGDGLEAYYYGMEDHGTTIEVVTES